MEIQRRTGGGVFLVEDPEHCDFEMYCSAATASPTPRTCRQSVDGGKPAKTNNIASCRRSTISLRDDHLHDPRCRSYALLLSW